MRLDTSDRRMTNLSQGHSMVKIYEKIVEDLKRSVDYIGNPNLKTTVLNIRLNALKIFMINLIMSKGAQLRCYRFPWERSMYLPKESTLESITKRKILDEVHKLDQELDQAFSTCEEYYKGKDEYGNYRKLYLPYEDIATVFCDPIHGKGYVYEISSSYNGNGGVNPPVFQKMKVPSRSIGVDSEMGLVYTKRTYGDMGESITIQKFKLVDHEFFKHVLKENRKFREQNLKAL